MTGIDKRRRQHGFTLIEILLVVTIIGILAGIVVVSTPGHMDRARRRKTELQAVEIKTAIMQFEMEVGRWPATLNELVMEGDANWPGPFLDAETVPKDEWGNDFRMERKGKRMRVTSLGPDGQLGTEDDIFR